MVAALETGAGVERAKGEEGAGEEGGGEEGEEGRGSRAARGGALSPRFPATVLTEQ